MEEGVISQGITDNLQELEKERTMTLSYSLKKEHSPDDILILAQWDSWPLEQWDNKFVLFTPLILW